jgi:hypothetical protein
MMPTGKNHGCKILVVEKGLPLKKGVLTVINGAVGFIGGDPFPHFNI